MNLEKGTRRKSKAIGIAMLLNIALFLSTASAQNTTPATGGNATGSGGSATYSVGQVFYTTNVGTNGSVAQGVQQPYEISVISAIEEAKMVTLQCAVYPNPTTNYLQLIVNEEMLNDLTYYLYDLTGKLIEFKKVESNTTSIDMSHLIPATYFLRVIKDKKEIKAFKIVKN
jgi:hypothetical protein